MSSAARLQGWTAQVGGGEVSAEVTRWTGPCNSQSARPPPPGPEPPAPAQPPLRVCLLPFGFPSLSGLLALALPVLPEVAAARLFISGGNQDGERGRPRAELGRAEYAITAS